MIKLPCPYLQAEVELSAERIAHISEQHPELPTSHLDRIANTLFDPDQVRIDPRFPHTRLFSRWFDELLEGKILVVAVVTDEPSLAENGPLRHWVVTAYPARRVTQGVIEWERL
jgi:hypothetical protein